MLSPHRQYIDFMDVEGAGAVNRGPSGQNPRAHSQPYPSPYQWEDAPQDKNTSNAPFAFLVDPNAQETQYYEANTNVGEYANDSQFYSGFVTNISFRIVQYQPASKGSCKESGL